MSSNGPVFFAVHGTFHPFQNGIYYAKLHLGTPAVEFYVEIDTGSDLFWVSCSSCNGCPRTRGPEIELNIFDPGHSSTSSLISCSDRRCKKSGIQTSNATCSSQNNKCSYSINYGDVSGTSGYLVSDTMDLYTLFQGYVASISSASIVFGCSNKRSGGLTKSDRAVDGVFGLGRQNISVISQLSSQGITRRVFSHCLRGDSAGGGILVLGEIVEPGIVYTPLVPSQPRYNLNLLSISVNGQPLQIDASVFATSNDRGTIVDSGTPLAYLPEEAYDPFVNSITAMIPQSVRTVFLRGNRCFLVTKTVTDIFPQVSLNFAGGASLDLRPLDYLIQQNSIGGAAVWCIAFQKIKGQGTTILGDLVLKDKIVVYDLAGQRIGWVNYDCSLPVNVSEATGTDSGEHKNVGTFLHDGLKLSKTGQYFNLISRIELETFIVNYFKNIFCGENTCTTNSMIADCVLNLVSLAGNESLIATPTATEIKAAISNMKGDGAPGPDGFSVHFYQCFWEIIASDVIHSVQSFFLNGKLPQHLNLNILILILKIPKADRIENFRPIALANFQFKIITKVLADRLALAINVLSKKSFAGNIALKVDIKKAFDTLDWYFLLSVLKQFGFEDVLSRSLTKALLDGDLRPMTLVETIPFTYLGCPIFVGKPKVIHFQAVTDKIKIKLASWKGALLSIMGRVQLIKAVIHGMLVYSFHIYAWPRSLIKKLDIWIRNFIWSGDVCTRKICTVTWSKICTSYDAGGLDLRSLAHINDSLMLHLCWNLFSSKDQWAELCRARFLKFCLPTHTYLRSSIWYGIKPHVHMVRDNSKWIIGTGTDISFWLDTWLDDSLAAKFEFPMAAFPHLTANVSSFIENREWKYRLVLFNMMCPSAHRFTIPPSRCNLL
ncbi:hypothetical protein TSUD_406600 [Trifolium subterraneum]|uniref:Peptidase A1 domain-containing protein n=1 Tax=Trifolium subterraneum TaxID=3900 RepID=A0A2Z6NXC6_TRISU|nr:hypothetical protein TSUD_406600 [Trifolium subterraneum]